MKSDRDDSVESQLQHTASKKKPTTMSESVPIEALLKYLPFALVFVLNAIIIIIFLRFSTLCSSKSETDSKSDESDAKWHVKVLDILGLTTMCCFQCVIAYTAVFWSILHEADKSGSDLDGSIALVFIYMNPIISMIGATSMISFFLQRLVMCFRCSLFELKKMTIYIYCGLLFIAACLYLFGIYIERTYHEYYGYAAAIFIDITVLICITIQFCSKLMILLIMVRRDRYHFRGNAMRSPTVTAMTKNNNNNTNNANINNNGSVGSVASVRVSNRSTSAKDYEWSAKQNELIQVATKICVLLTFALVMIVLATVLMSYFGLTHYIASLSLAFGVLGCSGFILFSFAFCQKSYDKCCSLCHSMFEVICKEIAWSKLAERIEHTLSKKEKEYVDLEPTL